jgi:dolichol-phosphate mannosyltransferase
MSTLSIVMPALNEEASLEAILQECVDAFADDGRLAEIVVVDDASTDTTRELAREFGKHDSRVRLVENEHRLGCIPSVMRGFREATAELCFFMPSDGQIPAVAARQALDAAEDGADVVLTRRIVRRDNGLRRIASSTYNRLLHLLAPDLPGSDIDSSFLIRRELVERRPATGPDTSFSAVELVLDSASSGASIVEVPIEHRPREAGEEKGLHAIEVRGALLGLTRLARHRLRRRDQPTS